MPETAATSRVRRPLERLALSSSGATLALGALMVVAFAFLFHKGQNTNFYFDDWNFVLFRSGHGADTFLQPHNEHLSIFPILVYKVLFATVGLDSYGSYRAVALLLHIGLAGLLFLFVRARAGGWVALLAAGVLLFLGSGFIDFMWAFQIGYLLSLTSGLGALLLLERRSARADWAATALLVVSVASSGMGLPLLAGAAVYVLWGDDRWARIKVVLIPVVLYGLWYLGYGKSALKRENVTAVPRYTADEVSGAMGGLTGLTLEWGRILAVVGVALLVRRVVGPGRIPRELAALVAVAAAFWVLNGLARADVGEPNSPRYIYPGALFVLLIGAELLRGVTVRGRLLAVVAVFAGAAVLSNLGDLRRGVDGLRDTDQAVEAELGALEIARDRVDPGYRPDAQRVPQVSAGPYLQAIDRYGDTPADAPTEIANARPDHAALADQVLLGALPVQVGPASPKPPPGASAPATAQAGVRRAPEGCVSFRPRPGADALEADAPRGGLLVRADGSEPAQIFIRRFAPSYPAQPVGTVPAGEAARVAIPRDRASAPWHVRITSGTAVIACGLGRAAP